MDIQIKSRGIIELDSFGNILINHEQLSGYIKKHVEKNGSGENYKTLEFAGMIELTITDISMPIEMTVGDEITERALCQAMGIKL